MFSSAHADMVLSVIEAIRGPISSPPCGQSGIRPQPSVAGGGGYMRGQRYQGVYHLSRTHCCSQQEYSVSQQISTSVSCFIGFPMGISSQAITSCDSPQIIINAGFP